MFLLNLIQYSIPVNKCIRSCLKIVAIYTLRSSDSNSESEPELEPRDEKCLKKMPMICKRTVCHHNDMKQSSATEMIQEGGEKCCCRKYQSVGTNYAR